MDIVDAQVHANMLGTEVTLAVMDALGVQGVLFDEYQRTDGDGAAQPGYRLADGTFRPIGPNAESAALRHPERFAFLMRVDPRDPGIEGWGETLAAAPDFKALRTLVATPTEGALFEDGGYDRLLKAARADSLPLFVTCPGRMLLLAGYAERFPDVQFVIDHCGAAFDSLRGEATIDDAVGMARYPNVAYKWAHAQALLSTTAYPFPDLEPKLRRAVDAYDPERVMWASDYTTTRWRANWGEALFSIRHYPSLSEEEKAWILGPHRPPDSELASAANAGEPSVVSPHLASSSAAVTNGRTQRMTSNYAVCTATVGTILGPHVMRDVARPARLRTSCTAHPRPNHATTSENVPPLFTGGQVVAGSNPVSPTEERSFGLRIWLRRRLH
jgi:L-fuconolactonase